MAFIDFGAKYLWPGRSTLPVLKLEQGETRVILDDTDQRILTGLKITAVAAGTSPMSCPCCSTSCVIGRRSSRAP